MTEMVVIKSFVQTACHLIRSVSLTYSKDTKLHNHTMLQRQVISSTNVKSSTFIVIINYH